LADQLRDDPEGTHTIPDIRTTPGPCVELKDWLFRRPVGRSIVGIIRWGNQEVAKDCMNFDHLNHWKKNLPIKVDIHDLFWAIAAITKRIPVGGHCPSRGIDINVVRYKYYL